MSPDPALFSPPPTELRRTSLEQRLQALEPDVVGDPVGAVDTARALEEEARDLGALELLGAAQCLRAGALFYQTRYAEAREVYAQVLQLGQPGDPLHCASARARALGGLAGIYAALGENTESLTHYAESASLAQRCGDMGGWRRAMTNLGLMHLRFRDHSEALRIFEELAPVTRAAGAAAHASNVQAHLVMIYSDLGHHEHATHLAAAYLAEPEFRPFTLHLLSVQLFLARSRFALGDVGPARDLLGEVRARSDEGARRGQPAHELRLRLRQTEGEFARQGGDLAGAERALTEALAQAQAHRLEAEESELHAQLAGVLEARGDLRAANRHLRRQVDLERDLHRTSTEHRVRLSQMQAQLSALEREMAHARYQADHDALTGLLGRAAFQREGERRLRAYPGEHGALLFLDLDGFKALNDRDGHAAGDHLLEQLAGRLRAQLGPEDLVARLAGDEFTVLLTPLPSPSDALAAAHRLRLTIREPFDLAALAARPALVTSSIGVVWARNGTLTVPQLLRQADRAMYGAKTRGKDTAVLHVAQASGEAPS